MAEAAGARSWFRKVEMCRLAKRSRHFPQFKKLPAKAPNVFRSIVLIGWFHLGKSVRRRFTAKVEEALRCDNDDRRTVAERRQAARIDDHTTIAVDLQLAAG